MVTQVKLDKIHYKYLNVQVALLHAVQLTVIVLI